MNQDTRFISLRQFSYLPLLLMDLLGHGPSCPLALSYSSLSCIIQSGSLRYGSLSPYAPPLQCNDNSKSSPKPCTMSGCATGRIVLRNNSVRRLYQHGSASL